MQLFFGDARGRERTIRTFAVTSSPIPSALECLDDEWGESCAIQAFVKGEKPKPIGKGMRTDNEARKNRARTTIVLFSASLRKSLEGSPGQSPHLRGQLPINTNSCFFKE